MNYSQTHIHSQSKKLEDFKMYKREQSGEIMQASAEN